MQPVCCPDSCLESASTPRLEASASSSLLIAGAFNGALGHLTFVLSSCPRPLFDRRRSGASPSLTVAAPTNDHPILHPPPLPPRAPSPTAGGNTTPGIGGRVARPRRHRREGRIVVIVVVVAALCGVRALTIIDRSIARGSRVVHGEGRRRSASDVLPDEGGAGHVGRRERRRGVLIHLIVRVLVTLLLAVTLFVVVVVAVFLPPPPPAWSALTRSATPPTAQ
jgi:hypothetical protein